MQMHLILALNGPESIQTLSENVKRVYPHRHRQLKDRSAWLVADDSTAKTVSEKLGINSGDGGIAALVTTMADYFGRAETELWSWIKVQWEATDGSSENTANAA